MWIPEAISGSDKTKNPFFGNVVYSSGGNIDITGNESIKNIEAVTPYGVAYVPPKGTRAVVLPVGNTAVVCGISGKIPFELNEGEVGFYSSGGASIVLKNDGTVLINGQEFERTE